MNSSSTSLSRTLCAKASTLAFKSPFASSSLKMYAVTVLPARFTCRAPAGTFALAAGRTVTMRAPLMTIVPFSIGALPSPTMIRAPSNAVTWARTGEAKLATTPTAIIAAVAKRFTRRMKPSLCCCLIDRILAPLALKAKGQKTRTPSRRPCAFCFQIGRLGPRPLEPALRHDIDEPHGPGHGDDDDQAANRTRKGDGRRRRHVEF